VNCSAIADRLYAAAESFQDEWEAHDVPSPSSVWKCRKALWYIGKRIPRSNRIPVRSIKTMERGKQAESFWHRVFAKAGFTVLILAGGSRIDIGSMTGEFDAFLIDKETGERYILELKDMGGWGYMKAVQEGIQSAEPDYYAQVQQYMAGFGLSKCIFVAGLADPSTTVWLWQKIKKLPGRPPDFHVEVIDFVPSEWAKAEARADEVIALLQVDTPPAPDFDPLEGKFPCGSDEQPYCGHRDICLGRATWKS